MPESLRPFTQVNEPARSRKVIAHRNEVPDSEIERLDQHAYTIGSPRFPGSKDNRDAASRATKHRTNSQGKFI